MVNIETVREETRMAIKELGSGKNTGTYNNNKKNNKKM